MRSRTAKLVLLSFVFCALAAAGTLMVPADAEAAGSCRCFGQKTTSVDWGFGYTCSEAEADLRAKLDTQTSCASGVCNKTLVIVTECHAYSAQLVQVDGYYQYSCLFCWQ